MKKDVLCPAVEKIPPDMSMAGFGEELATALRLRHGSTALADTAQSRLALSVAETLFIDPTLPSEDIAKLFGLGCQELIEIYAVIRESRSIQDALTFDSPLRRRVSFLRRELLPDNRTMLGTLFAGDVCLPCHVEFHPALVCNLRCKACPNCRPDESGTWHFIGYKQSGEALTSERLHLLQQLFVDMGVRSFSFGGGGEPSLSGLTVPAMEHLRSIAPDAEISLYTNGIFPAEWGAKEHRVLAENLNKVRFSIDAATAAEWSQYKGRNAGLFESLWQNIAQVVSAKQRTGSAVRIGASCLVSRFVSNVEGFLLRARETGLDFCDIKEIETCYGDKPVYQAEQSYRESLGGLLEKVQQGVFRPLDVVIDDNLLQKPEQREVAPARVPRCWVSIRGRMLTVGPYGELYPCSDAANPGSQYRRARQDILGQLSEFGSLVSLGAQFQHLWGESLSQRRALSKNTCAYCVPSHNNYNLALEKLYQDWKFGIMPEQQPYCAEQDHYQKSRGMVR
ncbi:hypothetical protein Selin_2474 [Desulfurispirillum indicum S5]|uniref:Radical SAM domain protein n=1 Tax=Desulfurispirillum indicum (strain ATCC BAA-1389 / DSM 22839 / S5) TaxID=653733 RepID=E6W5B0_DESIS|nr:radical SAM protein [Desulfurispirillum indicum]ADU67189.1 hypothetical protein Selin_2474 [Desulfurispirillum indicum S5]